MFTEGRQEEVGMKERGSPGTVNHPGKGREELNSWFWASQPCWFGVTCSDGVPEPVLSQFCF